VNSRNWTSAKSVATTVGTVDLDVPRDRLGSFILRFVPKGQKLALPSCSVIKLQCVKSGNAEAPSSSMSMASRILRTECGSYLLMTIILPLYSLRPVPGTFLPGTAIRPRFGIGS
jgi:hypothetical protein